VAALQSSRATGKTQSAESASTPTEASEPPVTAPPATQPQPEKPTAPAPMQEGTRGIARQDAHMHSTPQYVSRMNYFIGAPR
jgi:hypothetical protein